MGLPTALLLANAGYKVYGFDINQQKISMLKNGILPFKEKGLKKLYQQSTKNFHPSNILKKSDVFLITVPTPLKKDKSCDLSSVKEASKTITNVLDENNLIILESTVPPRTTLDVVKPILDKTKKNYYLSYASEKAMPGNTIYEMQYNHRIIGGINKESAEKTKQIYKKFVKAKIRITDTTTAETVKLMENTYRDVNIALANEFAQTLQKLKIDPWMAIQFANYHPRVNIHKPGPGVGGHCLPIDPWFIIDKDTKLIFQARRINDSMPLKVLNFVETLLKDIKKPTITLFGVAYKENIDDTRESPTLPFIKEAIKKNIDVKIYDPHVKQFPIPLNSLNESTKNSDCIVLFTSHSSFFKINPEIISTNMRTRQILDTKNALDKSKWIKAGFKYYLMFNSL